MGTLRVGRTTATNELSPLGDEPTLDSFDRERTIDPMTEPPAPVAGLLQAANDHDTDAFLACFTEDGVVDDWGREFASADAIRGWSDKEFIGVDVTLAVVAVTTDGDTTTVKAQVGSSGFNGASHFIFAVRDEHVARMTIRA
jgi:hypothetical protein